jgi:transposase
MVFCMHPDHARRLSEVNVCYQNLLPFLNEQNRRLFAGAQALALGRGGLRLVAAATGLALNTIRAGVKQLQTESPRPSRSRAPGGGRKKLSVTDVSLVESLERLVDPVTRGDPMSPLRWTCKSTTRLAEELRAQGHAVSQRTVCDLLHKAHYSLQGLRKQREGAQNPDRNAQFENIAAKVREFQDAGQPVISVDTKKKELIGDFKNGGHEWQPAGRPEMVRTHDFMDKELGKVAPYGVYDILRNEGWVSVGIDHDTSAFAVESIRRWWLEMGRGSYPQARRLLITADGGGSNGTRTRLWKMELQKLADEVDLELSVCHFPPGTSKWNKIEHRMFCHITQNWRGRPLVSRQAVVELIGQTTTQAGLKVRAALDEGAYPSGVKVTDEELSAVVIKPDDFHGEWNYTISVRNRQKGSSYFC